MLPSGASDKYWKAAQAFGVAQQGPISGSRVREPFEELAGKAGALGHLNVIEDADGRVRQLPLLIECQGRLLPALAFQMVLKHKGVRLRDVAVELDFWGQPRLQMKDLELLTDGAYRLPLRFDREWTRQRYFSYSEIVNGEIDPVIVVLNAGNEAAAVIGWSLTPTVKLPVSSLR